MRLHTDGVLVKILLILVLIMADGPKQTAVEVPTLEECWIRAQATIENADLPAMQAAGVIGLGTGCIAFPAPAQDTQR